MNDEWKNWFFPFKKIEEKKNNIDLFLPRSMEETTTVR